LVWCLSLAQLISWGSIFYMFSLVLEPLERDLGLSRAQVSLAFSLALLHALVCVPLHAWTLQGAPGRALPAPDAPADHIGPARAHQLMRQAPFLLIGVFTVLMMSVTVAIPAHMVSLLRENALPEAWVIALPAAIGVVQVIGRLLLYFFEHHADLHLVNRLVPLALARAAAPLLLGLSLVGVVALAWAQHHSLT